MDILIIGHDNPEMIERVKETVSDEDINVVVVEDLIISGIRVSKRGNPFEKYGYPCDENPDVYIGKELVVKSRCLGAIKHEPFIISVDECDKTPSLVELSERFNKNILRTIKPPIDIQKLKDEIDIFLKKIHIKSKPYQEKTKCLLNIHNNQNKSLLKQHNIKQQPIICRKHGVDNRR